jgi:hypothetical protein
MSALYQLAELYRDAEQTLADTDLPENVIADTLEGLSGTLQIKSTNVAMVMRNMEATVEAIDKAIADMTHRKKVIQNRADNLRAYLKQCMETAGITKIECPHFVLAIKKNPPKVVIDDAESVPADFMRIPELPAPEIDKKSIADALKSGIDVPGARLESGTRLDIK